jgi:hypothetical protein
MELAHMLMYIRALRDMLNAFVSARARQTGPHLCNPLGPGSSVVTSTSHSAKCDATPCHIINISCSSSLLNPSRPSESYSGVTMLSIPRYVFQPSVPYSTASCAHSLLVIVVQSVQACILYSVHVDIKHIAVDSVLPPCQTARCCFLCHSG